MSELNDTSAEVGVVCIAALVFGAGCLDLTPPWDQPGSERDGGTADQTWVSSGYGGSGPGTASGTGGMAGLGGSGGATASTLADASATTGGTGGHVVLQDARGSDAAVDVTSGAGGTSRADAAVGTGGSAGAGGRTSTSGAGGASDAGTTMVSPDSAAPGTGGSVGTGGRAGTGGVVGTGGLLGYGGYAPYDCANPVVPAASNVSGLVTDFTGWNATTGEWGTRDGLYGKIFAYSGTNGTMNEATVQGSPVGLHLTGAVGSNGYAGGGLTFLVVATLASFTQVQFDIYGGAPGCSLELQIQTFDQRPTTAVPAGSCNLATAPCYASPTMKQIVDVSSKLTYVKTVTTPLASFSRWSLTNAVQVVGLQWQFTGTSVYFGNTCPIDVTITNIRFLP